MIEQQRGEVRYLQFSHFLQFPALTHGVFTRLGGQSEAPYQGLNVSLSSGDNFENVMHNRLLALESLQLHSYPSATLWAIHGAEVATVDTEPWEWRFDRPLRFYSPEQQALILQNKLRWKADAIITQQAGISLALSFADCVPLLFYDPVHVALGIAHAGWRGTARGIAAATVEAMSTQFASMPGDLYAGIGPAIGPCCYEVSEFVQRLFYRQEQFEQLPTAERFRNLVRESAVFSIKQLPDHTSLRLNLWETNRNQLLRAGLRPEHIELANICTRCNTDRFFSHRGELGKAGRFPVLMALRNKDEV